MNGLVIVLVFLGFVALLIAIFVVSKRMEKKRQQEIQQLSQELGLTFAEGGRGELQNRLKRFEFFNQGRDQRMTNLIWADSGDVKLSIFDYRYTTGSGKNTSVNKATIAVVESSQLKLPRFSLRPESFLDRIGGALGFQDIDFESHPKFSRAFVLRGKDEPAVRKLMQKSVLDFFEGFGPVFLDGGPEVLFFYRSRRFVKSSEIKPLLTDAYSIYGCFVDSVSNEGS